MKFRSFFILSSALFFVQCFYAQSLLDELDATYPDTPQYTLATFTSSRIAMGHSVEILKKGVLEIGTRSRFWNLPDPEDNSQSFVADKMSTRISLEYGISDRFTFGVGGTTLDGIFDSFLKYKLIRQSKEKAPFSLTIFQNASYQSERSTITDVHLGDSFTDRLAFTSQLLLAKKISKEFSFQLSPTFIYRASSAFEEDPENLFALGIGGRYKIGGHVSVVSEYYAQFNPLESRDTYDAFALGVNWELSDVMLQFSMTNTRGLVEDNFITQTPNNFNLKDGNFVFGFTGIFILHLRNGLKK